jgi:hypothetical protein
VRRDVTGVVALILTALALPPLLARLTGGQSPTRVAQLAALAPAATVRATAAVIIAATTTPWLAVLLAIPAVICGPGNCLRSGGLLINLRQDLHANQNLLRQWSDCAGRAAGHVDRCASARSNEWPCRHMAA